jgi:cyclopropane fatty-acyl-phospholipid synthase-like methyltransferase
MNKFDMSYDSINSEGYKFVPNSSLKSFWMLAKGIAGLSDNASTLEVGCGAGLTLDIPKIQGIEISQKAKDLSRDEFTDNIYIGDFLTHRFNENFDVVLDSHMGHCLSSKDELSLYIKKVSNLLNSGGHFLLEIMVRPKNLALDSCFTFNHENSTIEKNGIVHRILLEARDIEDLVLDCGLKIVYLRVDGNIKFIPNSHRSESLPTDPDRMRLICLKE